MEQCVKEVEEGAWGEHGHFPLSSGSKNTPLPPPPAKMLKWWKLQGEIYRAIDWQPKMPPLCNQITKGRSISDYHHPINFSHLPHRTPSDTYSVHVFIKIEYYVCRHRTGNQSIMLKVLGTVNIFISSPLNVHWTFRSEPLPPPP